ncbi:hypothetical protein UYO_0283 [Lachnospiraceae bacterium JC7]|nr:hypothetical protein UYO_0283 [Lachnospiraceae bacterium JC7]
MDKYKRIIGSLLCVLVISSLSGCGDNAAATGLKVDKTKGVSDVLEAGMAEEDGKKDNIDLSKGNETESESKEESSGVNEEISEDQTYLEYYQGLSSEETSGKTDGIDVDLTELSGTMVFAEVYNMMMDPMSYIGKTVRMNGNFTIYHDDEKNRDHYACIIQDATACCSQGVEFMLTDDYSFPEDYPEEGEDICVTGVFKTYKEGKYTYWALMDAKKD